jgi:TetR/AcrR family transcriptional regulator, cholesterol catabolism regulator
VSRTTRAARSSKRDILSAFASAVARSGYDEVSFREIAEALEISKGTIVHHYGTKERLLEAVHREYMDRRLREAEIILATTTGAAARLTALVAQLMLAQRDDRDAGVTFAREVARFATMDLMADVRSLRATYTGLVRTVLVDGVASGEFVDVDVELVTLQVFGMCNWSWTWFGVQPRYTVVEVVEAWTTSLLTGLARGRATRRPDVAAIVAAVERVAAELA